MVLLSPAALAASRRLVVRGRVVAILQVLAVFNVGCVVAGRKLKDMVSNSFVRNYGGLTSGSTRKHERIAQIA